MKPSGTGQGVRERMKDPVPQKAFSGLLPEVLLDGNDEAPRVFIFTEHLNATYFISFEQPLRELHAAGRVNFAAVSQGCVKSAGSGSWQPWLEAFSPDVVVMSRYALPWGPEIMDTCIHAGIPVIYHIDDNLLELPDSLTLGVVKKHGAVEVVDARAKMLARCDLVYASTRELARVLLNRLPGQKVLHGDIYASYAELPNVGPAPGPVLGYMGSRGHQNDLELAVPAIEGLLEQRPGLRFEIFGSIQMPERLRRFGDRVRHQSVNQSYSEFLQTLASLGWIAGLAPLVDEPFNKCKAPTKYIEYTSAGIACVASRSPVYGEVIPEGAGLLVGPDGWEAALVQWLDHPGNAEQAVRAARVHCAATYSIERLTRQVETILTDLISGFEVENAIIRIDIPAIAPQSLAMKVLQHSARRHTNQRIRFATISRSGISRALTMNDAMLVTADLGKLWATDFSARDANQGSCVIMFSDPKRVPWLFARHPAGHLWAAEIRVMIEGRALSWMDLLDPIAGGQVRPSLLRDVKWFCKLPRPLRWLTGWFNTIADALQGFRANGSMRPIAPEGSV